MQNLTEENNEYIDVMARAFDITPTEFLNRIIAAHQVKNQPLFDKALEAQKAGAKLSLIK